MIRKPDIIINPEQSVFVYLKEVYTKRDVFLLLAWRDIAVRYKQSFFGIAWSLFRPILTMLIFTIIFGMVAKLPSNGIPYFLLVLSGLLPWMLFAHTINISASSLVDNAHLIRKVYFPRIIFPSTSIIIHLVDMFVAFIVLLVLMVINGFMPNMRLLFLPCMVIHVITLTLGVGFFISALNVRYRDFTYLIPFLVQTGYFISPIGFSTALVPEKWKLIFSLNPMVGIIDGFRWALLGTHIDMYWPAYFLSIIITLSVFIAGLVFFIKSERTMVDVL